MSQCQSVCLSPLKERYINVTESGIQDICYILYIKCTLSVAKKIVEYIQSNRLKPNKDTGFADFWIMQSNEDLHEICLSSNRMECLKVYKDINNFLFWNPSPINEIEWSEQGKTIIFYRDINEQK